MRRGAGGTATQRTYRNACCVDELFQRLACGILRYIRTKTTQHTMMPHARGTQPNVQCVHSQLVRSHLMRCIALRCVVLRRCAHHRNTTQRIRRERTFASSCSILWYVLEVCGSTHYPRGWVGIRVRVQSPRVGYGYTRFTCKEHHFLRCWSYIECF